MNVRNIVICNDYGLISFVLSALKVQERTSEAGPVYHVSKEMKGALIDVIDGEEMLHLID